MLKLTVYPAAFSEISASPFSVKALCLMEASKQDYIIEYQADPRKTPKHKLPVLQHGSKIIPDSDQIRDYMEANFDLDYDQGLNAEQRGQSRSIIRMVEESLYFCILTNKWQNDKHWSTTRDEFFGEIPKLLKLFLPNLIRKNIVKQAKAQGMGRHSFKEQIIRAEKDIQAIESILGKKKFLFGAKPTAADMSVVPMLRAAAFFPINNELSDLIVTRPSLMAYIDRGKDKIYPSDDL